VVQIAEPTVFVASCPLFERGKIPMRRHLATVGSRGVAGDQRVPFGTIHPTILFNPERSHVLAAKVVAGALAGIAFGVLGEGIGWAIGYAILEGRGITVVLNSGDILLLTLGGLAGVALWGAIGAGLGGIIHNQVGGIIALLAWGFVVNNLLFGLVPSVGRFMPTRASDALMGLRVHHLVSPGVGAITLIAWAGALGVLGIAVSARQDIN
jgi:ABC-2 type transport system permease protein